MRRSVAILALALGIAFGPAAAVQAEEGRARPDTTGVNAFGPEPALETEALAEQRAQGPSPVSIGGQVPRWPAVILWDEVRQGRPKAPVLIQIEQVAR